MKNEWFENCLRQTIEVEELDDPMAKSPLSESCLTLPRLEILTMHPEKTSEREEEHLKACRICGPRRDAFLRIRVGRDHGKQESRAIRGPLLWVSGVAAAALILGAVVLGTGSFREQDIIVLSADCTTAPEGSISRQRSLQPGSLPPGEGFFVRVELDRPAWVRLIAVDRQGELHSTPLDNRSRVTMWYSGEEKELFFGDYPRSGITSFLVIATLKPIEEKDLLRQLTPQITPEITPEDPDLPLRELAAHIRETFHAATKIVQVPPAKD